MDSGWTGLLPWKAPYMAVDARLSMSIKTTCQQLIDWTLLSAVTPVGWIPTSQLTYKSSAFIGNICL